jgi:NTE family protein
MMDNNVDVPIPVVSLPPDDHVAVIRRTSVSETVIVKDFVPVSSLPKPLSGILSPNPFGTIPKTNILKNSTSYYVVDKNAKGNQQLDTDIENLIFRGGGMKGIAYCGALDVISNLGMLGHVKRFAGTSAGSMLATFLACGYTSSEIERVFRTTNFQAFKDAKKGLIAKMENLYRKFGMYEGKVFYEWMGRRIAEKTENPDITFEELYNRTHKDLVVVGTCLSHCQVHYFSHHTAPHMKVRDAVRISMSIPLFFEPVKEGDHFFVDGCVLDNFPLWVFDCEEFNPETARMAPVNTRTIGFYIVEDSEVEPEVVQINGLKEYVGCMLNAFMNRISQLAFKPGDEGRMLHIKARHIQAANFGLEDPEKDLLYHEGQLAARRFYGVTEAHLGDDFVKVNQLIVRVKSGLGLKGVGRLHGDIYVKLSVGSITRKSSMKRSTHPVWDDVYVFKAQEGQVLKVEVIYHKSIRADKTIATREINISEIESDVKKDFVVDTEDGGHITLQLLLSPAL